MWAFFIVKGVKHVQKISKLSVLLVAFLGLGLLLEPVFAGEVTATGLGLVAQNISGSFQFIGQLLIGVAYLAGIGFGIASIFKFKQHKDNPTQIPVGTPIALLVIAVALVFLPLLFKPAGETLFGKTEAEKLKDGFTGGGASLMPGG